MKKWIQKAIVQKTISYLPFSHKINYLFQKYVTKAVYLTDEYFFDRLSHAQEHLASYRKYSHQVVPRQSLEIGTGWYPIVPISFFLVGVEKIFSVDISFLTSKERILTTLRKFVTCHDAGQLQNYVNYIPAKYEVLTTMMSNYESLTLEQILATLHITYLIEDARKLSLPDNSVDLVNSNNTFEHIYPHILIPILKDFKRVVNKSHGVMSHSIDMSDHFAHFDKTVTIYNFLQYSDKQWTWIDNSIQPQSRLRIYDYKKIYADLGIPITEESYRPGDLDALASIPLADKYAHAQAEENAKSHCHFVSDMHAGTAASR